MDWNLTLKRIRIGFRIQLINFDADPDVDPDFYFMRIPGYQIDADPCGSGSTTLPQGSAWYLLSRKWTGKRLTGKKSWKNNEKRQKVCTGIILFLKGGSLCRLETWLPASCCSSVSSFSSAIRVSHLSRLFSKRIYLQYVCFNLFERKSVSSLV